jgi:anti-sigma28 factor (negative regulator of flagellin synthesis)
LPISTKECAGQCHADWQTDVEHDRSMASPALSGRDIRTEKIAALQRAIAARTYHVSSSDIAGKLINALLKERI